MKRAALLGAALALVGGCADTAPPAAAPVESTVTGIVRDTLTGAPIAGAQVRVEGLEEITTTDVDGRYALTLPAGTHELAVLADGHLPVTTPPADVALWPEHASDDAADRWLATRQAERDLLHDSPDDADLRPEARAILRGEAPFPDVGATTTIATGDVSATRAALSAPPATIRVWRRGLDGSTASCSGRVDVIALEDYVKGVVPHEWIASWDDESLRAGALAVRTYSWRWISAGGKYTCADLDDTTASQVYRDDRNARASADVDATRGQAITSGGSLVSGEYSAENGDPTAYGVVDSVCAGHAVAGHGRGMCQWGSQRWALAGRDHVWIAEHYYPGAAVEGGTPPRPAYDASYVGQSAPSDMTSGDRVAAWVDMRNDGTTAWSLTGTFLGTSMPHDHASPLYDAANWVNDHRASAPDHSGYGTGATGRFTFMLHAPDVAADTVITEHFALVQEGVTWFGPDTITVRVTVHPRAVTPPPVDAGTPTAHDAGAPAAHDAGTSAAPDAAALPPGDAGPLGTGADAGGGARRPMPIRGGGCSVSARASGAPLVSLMIPALGLALALRRRVRRR